MGDYEKPGNHTFFLPWTEKKVRNPDKPSEVRYVVNDHNGSTKNYLERSTERDGERGRTAALRTIFSRPACDAGGDDYDP